MHDVSAIRPTIDYSGKRELPRPIGGLTRTARLPG